MNVAQQLLSDAISILDASLVTPERFPHHVGGDSLLLLVAGVARVEARVVLVATARRQLRVPPGPTLGRLEAVSEAEGSGDDGGGGARRGGAITHNRLDGIDESFKEVGIAVVA